MAEQAPTSAEERERLEALRLSALRVTRSARPEAVPLEEKELNKLSVPDPGELRAATIALDCLAHNILSAIPSAVIERQDLFSPPLSIPAKEDMTRDPGKALELLDALSKRVDWRSVYSEDRDACRRVREAAGYIAEIGSRCVLGLTKEADAPARDVTLASLDQAGRMVALLTPGLKAAYGAIPTPEAWERPNVDGLSRESHANDRPRLGSFLWTRMQVAVADIQYGVANFCVWAKGKLYMLAKQKLTGLVDSLRRTFEPTLEGIVDVGRTVGKFSGQSAVVWGVACLGLSALSGGAASGLMTALLGAGLIAGGAAYLCRRQLYKAAGWGFERLKDGLALLGQGASVLWEGTKWVLKWTIGKPCSWIGRKIGDFLSRDSAWGPSRWIGGLQDIGKQFTGFIRRDGTMGRIDTRDPEFFSRMSVLDANVVTRSDGRLKPLRGYVMSEARKHPGLLDTIFPPKTFEAPLDRPNPQNLETFVSVRARPGENILPVPLGYQVTGLKLLGKDGKPVQLRGKREGEISNGFPLTVRECVFGSASVELPDGVHTVVFAVNDAKRTVSPSVIRAFNSNLPRVSVCLGIEGEAFRKAMSLFPLDDAQRIQLLFQHQVSRDFVYTNDDFVNSFVSGSGSALGEAVAGIRAGKSDAFAYFVTAMFLQHDIPSLVLTGLVPDKGRLAFSAKQGHVQSAVLQTSGPLTFDLCANTRDVTLKSDALDLHQRYQILTELKKMTYEGVFYLGSELREVLTSPDSERLLERLTRALKKVVKPLHNAFSQDYGSINYGKGIHDSSHGQGQFKYGRAIEAISARIALEQHIENARAAGQVASVFHSYKHTPRMPQLADEDKALLVPPYLDTPRYDIRSRVVSFVGETLKRDDIAREEREAGLRWALEKLPRPHDVVNLGRGELQAIDVQVKRRDGFVETLRTGELISVLDERAIMDIDEDDLKSSLLGALGVPFAEHWRLQESESVRAELLSSLGADGLLSYAGVIERLAHRSIEAGVVLSREERVSFNNLLCALGSTAARAMESAGEADHTKLSEAVACFSSALATINGSAREEAVSIIFDAVHHRSGAYRDGIVHFLRVAGREGVFGASRPEERVAEEQALAREVTGAYLEKSVHDQPLDRWKETLGLARELGFDPAEAADVEAMRAKLSQDLKRLARRDPTFINYPVESAPGSFLLSRMTAYPSVVAWRVAELFGEHGFFPPGSVEKEWPARDEGKAVTLFWDSTRYESNKDGLMLHVEREVPPGASPSIDVAEVFSLSRDVLGNDGRLRAMISYNRFRRPSEHWAENAFRIMSEKFPEEWRRHECSEGHRQDLIRGALADLYDDVSRDEAYRGLLWYAAHRLSPDLELRQSRFLTAIGSLDPSNRERGRQLVDLPIRICFEEPDSFSAALGDLPRHVRIATVIACSMAADRSRDPLAPRHNRNGDRSKRFGTPTKAVDKFLSETLEIDARLSSVVHRPLPRGGDPMTSVWSALFKQAPSRSLDLAPLASEAASRAALLERSMKDSLRQFLYSRTGKILVLSSGGDFQDHREYADGDDYRRIDWRASARTDRLLMRVNQEEEARPLTVVCDVERIASGVARWQRHVSAKREADAAKKPYPHNPDDYKPKELCELYTVLGLAAAENIDVDLAIFGRSHLATIEGAVKRNGRSERGRFDAGSLSSTLGPILRSAMDVFTAERKIYDKAGFPAVDIFAGGDLASPRGSIAVFDIADKNRELSVHAFEELRARGKMAVLMKSSTPKEGA